MELLALTALSPLDGRYHEKLASFRPFLSEYGLIRYRVHVEIAWLLFLTMELKLPDAPHPDASTGKKLERLNADVDLTKAKAIKAIEKKINHDVKAVEYFLQEQCQADASLKPFIPFIHFGCTSEDINNLAYALALKNARDDVLVPALTQVIDHLRQLAKSHAEESMLSRTHGQPASPTTLGKELANFAARLQEPLHALSNLMFTGKMNGAVGNFNAHRVAYPDIDWPKESRHFIEAIGLEYNAYTTQIEPHDRLAELFQILVRINNILIDCCRDIWGYISLNYFQQKMVAGEVGSSTMPHKINPIDFENAEGNLGLSNALLNHLANKLTISRWQRDLSDSTVMRNCGSAFGYTLIAYQAITKGLSKLKVNPTRLQADLESHWEVLAEPLQMVMRRYGISDAYEQLKALTRGKSVDQKLYLSFINSLNLPEKIKKDLQSLTPAKYIGFASELAKKLG